MSNRNNRHLAGKVARAAVRSTARSAPRAVAQGVLPHRAPAGRNAGRRGRVRPPKGLLLSLIDLVWTGVTVFVLFMYAINVGVGEINFVVFFAIFFGSIILNIIVTNPLRRRRKERFAQQMHETSWTEAPMHTPNPAATPTATPARATSPAATPMEHKSMEEIAASLHGLPFDEAARSLAEQTGIPVDRVPKSILNALGLQTEQPHVPSTAAAASATTAKSTTCPGCDAPRTNAPFCEYCGTKLS